MKKSHRFVIINQTLRPERDRVGAGAFTKRAIAAVVKKSPLPAVVKAKILGCAGCDTRAEAMDRIVPAVPDVIVRMLPNEEGKP